MGLWIKKFTLSILCSSVLSSLPGSQEAAAKTHSKEKAVGQKKIPPPNKKGALTKGSFQEILDRYLFIGDFTEKSDTRSNSEEVFWRYPFKLAPKSFSFDLKKEPMDAMAFQIKGDGRLAEHLAKGRVEYLNGKYNDAHLTWLAARQLFPDDAKMNRRLEFFLGLASAQSLREHLEKNKDEIQSKEARQLINRVSYFLAAAFILRRDTIDPEIEKFAPWGLYNLSVAYYDLGRWAQVVGSAQEGLQALLKAGAKQYRPQFRQMLAEMWIKNDDLLSAIQELDTAIRQDPVPEEAIKLFNRAGDIYYGLNNFELADEVYQMASRIDELQRQLSPTHAVLRAESKFWLGHIGDARNLLLTAVDVAMKSERDWLIESSVLPWINLRIADTWLAELVKAKKEQYSDLLEKTRLAYFRVEQNYPKTEAAQIAMVRGACMDLPSYQGKNVDHARATLENVMDEESVPESLMELVNACYTASFSDRERTPEMVEKVKEFSAKYPNSKFLNAMIPAVQEVQAKNIEPYFEKNFLFSATEFFEKKRQVLFAKVSDDLAKKLFTAYVDTNRSQQAQEFWPAVSQSKRTDLDMLRHLTFLAEIANDSKTPNKLKSTLLKDRLNLIKLAEKREWSAEAPKESRYFLNRLIGLKQSRDDLIWIYRASKIWTKKDSDQSCSVIYPLLDRIHEQRSDADAKKLVTAELTAAIDDVWSAGSKAEATCKQSFLDLETKCFIFADLAKKYEKRSSWDLTGPWLERLWVHSEELAKKGQKKEARAYWEKIVKSGPADSFEVKMAKTRLEPTQTEFEQIWK
jgi:tetratricopeptide (TPR) repeat protein